MGLVERVVTNGLEYSNVDLILLWRTVFSSTVCACQNITSVLDGVKMGTGSETW